MASGYDILIFPGQSNTVGLQAAGTFQDTDPALDYKIFQISRGRSAPDGTIVPAVRPLDYWLLPNGHASDLSIARRYARDFLARDRNVLMIPAAESATSILQWLQLDVGSGDDLYDDMVTRVNIGLAVSGSVVKAWFENQGEEDVSIINNPNDSRHALMPDGTTYQTRKLAWIDKIRGLGWGTFPMIFGRFCPLWLPGDAGKAAVEAAIVAAAAARTQCAAWDSTGLHSTVEWNSTFNPVHYSIPSHEEIARRAYILYCQIVGFPVLDGFTNDGLRGSNL